MSPRQRAVLAAMVGNEAMSLADIAEGSGLTYKRAHMCLWLLEDSGHVQRIGDSYRILPRGAEEAARTPVEPRVPARRAKTKGKTSSKRRAAAKRTSGPKRKTGIRAKSFSEKYADPEGPRYGSLFLVVRVLRCWLDEAGYAGPGHTGCGVGVQGGHTAHHVGRLDAEGLIPVCGLAHDLVAGLGSRSTQREFRRWLFERDLTIEKVGLLFVAKAREISEGGYDDGDLAW